MKFATVRPYLPCFVGTLYSLSLQTRSSTKDKRTLLYTAVAAAGCFLATKSAGCFGLSMGDVARYTIIALPEVAQMGIGGYFVIIGVLGAVAAVKAHNYKSLVKCVALATCGYVANTPQYAQLYRRQVEKMKTKLRQDSVAFRLEIVVAVIAGCSLAVRAGKVSLAQARLFTAVVLLPKYRLVHNTFKIWTFLVFIGAGAVNTNYDLKGFARHAILLTAALAIKRVRRRILNLW